MVDNNGLLFSSEVNDTAIRAVAANKRRLATSNHQWMAGKSIPETHGKSPKPMENPHEHWQNSVI